MGTMTGHAAEMPWDEIDQRRIRIKQLVAELARWPSSGLVTQLCREADRAIALDAQFSSYFLEVREAGLALLAPGSVGARSNLPRAVEQLDDIVAIRKTLPAPA